MYRLLLVLTLLMTLKPPPTPMLDWSVGASFSSLQPAHISEQIGIDLANSNQIKNWRFIMFLSGYIIVFVIGLGFGFLLGARMILRGIDQPGEHL